MFYSALEQRKHRWVSVPWVTSFIFSFIKARDPLENTSVVLKDFWTPRWTLRTGLAAAYNQCTAMESVTVYQVIESCEMIMHWRRACGVITADHDIALSLNSNHPAFRSSSDPICCWEACQQNASTAHQHAPDVGLLYRKEVKNAKWNVITRLDFPLTRKFLQQKMHHIIYCVFF